MILRYSQSKSEIFILGGGKLVHKKNAEFMIHNDTNRTTQEN